MKLQAIATRLVDLRRCVLERVRKVNDLTQRGTLEAGGHLNKVVETARRHIDHLRNALVGASNNSLHRAIESHGDHLRRHSSALDEEVATHATEVANLTTTARQITDAAREVERASAAARTLSLNAQIESARSGAGTFKTIAIEMRDLSRAIIGANTRIQTLSHTIEVTLPRLVAQTEKLRAMVATYTSEARTELAEVDREVNNLRTSIDDTLATSDHALDAIIQASFAGLSALQFQDVCAQSLLQVDAWQAEALRSVAAETGVQIEIEDAPTAISVEDGILDHNKAGEVMLF